MNQQQEVHQLDNAHLGEVNVSKHFIVIVIGYNIACVGLYGAVNELVVIRVCRDEVETICGINQFNMPTLHQGVNDSFCKSGAKESFQNFLVFEEYLVRNAQCVKSLQHREPNVTVNTMTANALHEAVCIEDNAHIRLLGLLLSLLFAQPSMEIHLVDFVKTLLVKLARLPHFLSHAIEPLSIVIGYELLDVVQFLVAFDMGKHAEEIELGGVEHRWLNIIHNQYTFSLQR